MTKPLDKFAAVPRLEKYLVPGHEGEGYFYEECRQLLPKTKSRPRGWIWVQLVNDHAIYGCTFDEAGRLIEAWGGCECGNGDGVNKIPCRLIPRFPILDSGDQRKQS